MIESRVVHLSPRIAGDHVPVKREIWPRYGRYYLLGMVFAYGQCAMTRLGHAVWSAIAPKARRIIQ